MISGGLTLQTEGNTVMAASASQPSPAAAPASQGPPPTLHKLTIISDEGPVFLPVFTALAGVAGVVGMVFLIVLGARAILRRPRRPGAA